MHNTWAFQLAYRLHCPNNVICSDKEEVYFSYMSQSKGSNQQFQSHSETQTPIVWGPTKSSRYWSQADIPIWGKEQESPTQAASSLREWLIPSYWSALSYDHPLVETRLWNVVSIWEARWPAKTKGFCFEKKWRVNARDGDQFLPQQVCIFLFKVLYIEPNFMFIVLKVYL